jgi:hypothetical protein
MLHQCDKNLITRPDAWPGKALGDEVDRFSRATRKHDLPARLCIDKPTDILAGALISIGGTLAQGVNATVNIRMIVFVVIDNRLHDLSGALRRCGIIQIRQWPAIDLLVQNREIRA